MRDFYVVTLSKPGAAVARYALYELIDTKEGDQSVKSLAVVWPTCKPDKEGVWKVLSLMPCQVFYPKPAGEPDKFPAYHFAVKAVGYSRLEYLKDALQNGLGVPVRLFVLDGWAPCLH